MDKVPTWLCWVVGINLLLTVVTLCLVIVALNKNGFRVSRWYARLRRQGNPYLDFPVIRAPTTKFPNF